MWIPVKGYQKMPVGEWLVYVPEDSVNKFQVALVHEKISTIGGHFAFDVKPVTHYQELPEPPE